MALFVYDEEKRRLPDSLDELAELEFLAIDSLKLPSSGTESPPEPPIYLGRWLTMDSDGSLPLLISPSYSKNGAKVRQVLTMGSELVEIRDEEVDAWIDKAMAAGSGERFGMDCVQPAAALLPQPAVESARTRQQADE